MPEAKKIAPWVFYGSLGMIVLIPFLFRTTAVFLVNVIGFVYPTFASSVAILKNDEKLTSQWLIYWVIYALVLVFQRIFSIVLNKIPLFPLFNALFLIALMHYPYGEHSTLAKYVYWKFIAKYFGKATVEADDALNKAAGQMQKDPQGFAGQLMDGNENKIRLSELGEQAMAFGASHFNRDNESFSDDESDMTSARQTANSVAGAAGAALTALAEEAKALAGDTMNAAAAAATGSLSDAEDGLPKELSEGTNNNQGKASESASDERLELYKQKHGKENWEKISASEEVLALSDSKEDFDVDVAGDADATDDDAKKEL